MTGLCSRQACPLANSRYATVRADAGTGVLYLYMKTIERAHLPSRLWQRIKLSENYARALQQIDERLVFWPKFLVHKCKQRMTRLAQVALRARKLLREGERMGEAVVGRIAPKVRRREATRERKALAAAKVERQIERELIERLRSGAYGEQPLNVDEAIWKKVLRGLERGGEAQRDVDLDRDEDDQDVELEDDQDVELEDEEDDEEEQEVEYVSGDDELDDEEEGDLEDIKDWFESEPSDGSSEDDDDDDDDDDGDDRKEADKKRKRSTQPAPKPRKRESIRVSWPLPAPSANSNCNRPSKGGNRIRRGERGPSIPKGVGLLNGCILEWHAWEGPPMR